MIQWVGHKEVARRDIKGKWKRFVYYLNGHMSYIYCHNRHTFINLFAGWCQWVSQWGGKYVYTLQDVEGEDITLEDIIMDRPEGSPFRCKILIPTNVGEYIQ
jgi:hypothetical protein